ncbi:MAG TPA: ABC transporter permease, partial [Anaerolineaceae bacterium]
RLQTGHLQVRAKTYSDDKTSLAFEDLVENPTQIAAQIAGLAPVKAATPRLFASGIISKQNNSVGVRVMGMDPASVANAPFRNGMVNGTYLAADDREGVLVGKALADKMGYKTGDQIDLLVNTSTGNVAEQLFTIRGIFNSSAPGFDQTTLLMPLDKAQAISQAGNHASIIFVLLKDVNQADSVASALKTSQYEVITWAKLNELALQTEQLARGYMVLLYLIVLGITATVIVNTLIMSVFERTREIGILSAMGMRATRIMSMFFAESSLLAVGGILLGLIIGGLMVLYATNVGFYIGNFGYTSGFLLGERIYAAATVSDTVSLLITAFIVTLLAGLYPAVVAARMEPVQALHGGN